MAGRTTRVVKPARRAPRALWDIGRGALDAGRRVERSRRAALAAVVTPSEASDNEGRIQRVG